MYVVPAAKNEVVACVTLDLGAHGASTMSKSPALLASAEAVFAEDDSVVIAAFEVCHHRHCSHCCLSSAAQQLTSHDLLQAQRVAPNADITGAQLLKALGGKVIMALQHFIVVSVVSPAVSPLCWRMQKGA